MRNKTLARTLGRLIRELRTDAGYSSQESFAIEIGIHRNEVSLIERGQTAVSFEILVKICEIAHVSISDFCRKLEDNLPPSRRLRLR